MKRFGVIAAAAWLMVALAAAAPAARAEVAVPPVARVTDLTGTLDATPESDLERTLADLETAKGSQIAVLMVPTTEPEDIAQYGIRVADAWKLGRKGVDDGAILIVALADQRVRIEVGRGLEGAITDLTSNRIIEEYLRPRFRAGDIYGGISSAVDRLVALVNGEPLPAPPARQPQRSSRGGTQGVLPILLILAVFGGPLLRGPRPAARLNRDRRRRGVHRVAADRHARHRGARGDRRIHLHDDQRLGLGGGRGIGGGFGGMGGFGGGGFSGGGGFQRRRRFQQRR